MRAARATLGRLAAHWPGDRRVRFHDVSDPRIRRRGPRSPVLQLYSAHPNIGNFTPVLGIHALLGHAPDAWCVHRPIDFDFVHRHYRCVIVGGAGLLHPVFEPFWRALGASCRLPFVVWGVGGCFPDAGADATRSASGICPSAPRVARRAALVNLRDDLSADRLGVAGADISACPTVAYLDRRFGGAGRGFGPALYSSHRELLGESPSRAVAQRVARRFPDCVATENLQTRREGVHDLIRRRYLPSRLVVTTRLHGAIIAYGLGIPYVALARDDKLRAFARLYGGGSSCDDLEALDAALSAPPGRPGAPIALGPVRDFAERVRGWLRAYGALPAEDPALGLRRGAVASVS